MGPLLRPGPVLNNGLRMPRPRLALGIESLELDQARAGLPPGLTLRGTLQ